MARSFIFQCDCCVNIVERADGNIPPGWADIQIEATGFKGWKHTNLADISTSVLLCEGCQRVLHHLVTSSRRWDACQAGAPE